MRQLPPFPDSYWQKYSEQPVAVLPFDPHSQEIAQKYIANLKKILADFPNLKIYHRGSTALKISGKGDIEIGILPSEDQWFEIILILANFYHALGNLELDYARFNDRLEGYEIEIILMKNYTAELDQKLHEYLAENKSLLREYEQLKQKCSHSQREYNFQKDLFFRKVIEQIPIL